MYTFFLDSSTKMVPGTSPAIASDGTATQHDSNTVNPAAHIEAAFQGLNGQLYIATTSTDSSNIVRLDAVSTGYPMAPGTNPAITYVDGGYQVAFQGSDGDLWLLNSSTGFAANTGIEMASGTSPAIG